MYYTGGFFLILLDFYASFLIFKLTISERVINVNN